MQAYHPAPRPIASGLNYGVAVVALAGLGVWLTDDAGQTAVPMAEAAAAQDPLTPFRRRGEYTTDGSAQPGAQRCGECWHASEGAAPAMMAP